MPSYKNGSAYDDVATSPGNDIKINWDIVIVMIVFAKLVWWWG